MNLTAFAVIIAVQHERDDGDELSGLAGLGRRNPWLAWPMTIAMLALAGIPGTVGFIGKFQLIHALVDGGYTWLAVVLVIGSMISLGYYLRVVATLWMRDEVPAPGPGLRTALMGRGGLAPIAGGSPEADEETAALSRHRGRAAWRRPGPRRRSPRWRCSSPPPAWSSGSSRRSCSTSPPMPGGRWAWARRSRAGQAFARLGSGGLRPAGRHTPHTRSTGRKPADS